MDLKGRFTGGKKRVQSVGNLKKGGINALRALRNDDPQKKRRRLLPECLINLDEKIIIEKRLLTLCGTKNRSAL